MKSDSILSWSSRGTRQGAGAIQGLLALGFAAGLALAGCGNAAQREAYERAAQAEQHFTAEKAPALVAEYRRVIALEPGSALAREAEARIQAMEARVRAEELHKSVFQEHGID